MLNQETTSDLGVNVGLGLQTDLSGLRSAVGTLNDALSHTSAAVGDLTEDVIRLVDEVGIDTLVQMAKEGSEEVMQLLRSLYSALHRAAKKGVEEAGEMLSTIGRKMEEAGVKIGHTCTCKHSQGV